MSINKIVLAVGAHADDCEFSSGGTLAKFSKMGYKVFICNVLSGDKASAVGKLSNEEVSKIREKEARESASVIGAELIFGLGFNDGELNYISKEVNDRMIDVIRYANPDIIITQSPTDRMIHDHTITSQLVFNASIFCALGRYRTKNKAIDKSPRVFYLDTAAGVHFEPYEYVDITDTFKTKMEMLSKYKSQVDFMSEGSSIHFTDLLDLAETTAKFRGYQCGVKYAEGFVRMSAYLKNYTGRDLP
jgi:LmbE family N-acetylglucosaminyl deacetylase